jgi:glucose-1-phosphate thymidylyltransferase
MWGIIPAAGIGSRIQPLAFSKELLPVGSYNTGSAERPRAVSEYLVERLVTAGADKICFVISPGKSDILDYFGGHALSASIFYAVQERPAGLCDAIFRARQLISPGEQVCIGLPDTIWFPQDALAQLPDEIRTLRCRGYEIRRRGDRRASEARRCDFKLDLGRDKNA